MAEDLSVLVKRVALNWIANMVIPRIRELCPNVTGELLNSLEVNISEDTVSFRFTAPHAQWVIGGRGPIRLRNDEEYRRIPMTTPTGSGSFTTKWVTLSQKGNIQEIPGTEPNNFPVQAFAELAPMLATMLEEEFERAGSFEFAGSVYNYRSGSRV
jgi:hypothetical protein